MGTYLFRTENVAIASAAAGTTFTHGLGVAPAGENGAVFITMRTNTGVVRVISSDANVVVLGSTVDNAAVDLVVMRFHSILK